MVPDFPLRNVMTTAMFQLKMLLRTRKNEKVIKERRRLAFSSKVCEVKWMRFTYPAHVFTVIVSFPFRWAIGYDFSDNNS